MITRRQAIAHSPAARHARLALHWGAWLLVYLAPALLGLILFAIYSGQPQ
jgi:hypothetical protein